MTKKRIRSMPIYVWVRPDEMEVIQGRMAEAGISNLSAYVRKMALNGYVLHVDLSDIRELVSLQRRCANNLNQVAIQANTYGGIYPEEIAQLQKDYAALWEPLSDLLKKLSAVTELRMSGGWPCAVPRFSRLQDKVSRSGESQRHPCCPIFTEL